MVAYSFKRRFVAPIAMGLGLVCPAGFQPDGIEVRPKRQTMRALRRGGRHSRIDEPVSLYWGLRTRSVLKIGIGNVTVSESVELVLRGKPEVILGNGRKTGNTITGSVALDQFAQSDGFEDWYDLCRFWHDENGMLDAWSGWIICWEPVLP